MEEGEIRVYPAVPSRLGVVCLLGVLAFGARDSHAQQGRLRGIVTDSAGTPIRDADIGIVALRKLTRTDDQGRFAFNSLRRGDIEVSVRRLGYHPQTAHVLITAGTIDALRVTLLPRAALLSSVEVAVTEERRREGIEDFHRRRIRGIGTYITREQIAARHSGTTSDVLRTTPGLRVVRLRGGGRGVRFETRSITRRDCMPMIWIDGQKAPGLEVDDITFTDIEGIELYNGPSTTPMQFSQGSSTSTCGTIVIWTRTPGI